MHASAGFIASSITTAFLAHFKVKGAPWIGLGVGTALGIGKEVYDKYSGKGNDELLDAVCSISGAAAGSLTMHFTIEHIKGKEKEKKKL